MEGLLEMVNNASGGEGLFDGLKEIVSNAETGTINRSIEMLQSHRRNAGNAGDFGAADGRKTLLVFLAAPFTVGMS